MQPRLAPGKRAWPRAPIKRHSFPQKLCGTPVPSPPAIVLRHFGAGADGVGHSPAAVAACDLFVNQQQHRDAQAREQALEEKMVALGRAAGQHVSASRELKSVDAAVAQACIDRSKQRLKSLDASRRLLLARENDDCEGSPMLADHMSFRKTAGHVRGLLDCTNTMVTPCQRNSTGGTCDRLILKKGYFQ